MRLVHHWHGRRPLRYLIVGGWNTLFGFAFYTLLYLIFGKQVGYLAVLAIAQVVAVAQSHITQRLLVWRSHAPYLRELARFSTVYIGAFAANLALLPLCVEGLHTPALETQWVIGLALILPTYVVQRAWAFRAGPAPSASE